ncbi:unnamed protein product [Rhizophagus irregularis]|nr:unnamed protein product [Rhizophagus irregularis]
MHQLSINNLTVEPHPKACYTSHLLDFTSKELNEILEESQELSSFELKQDVDAEQELPEFINAPIEHNNLTIEPHPKACYTSHLLDFTSKELNENLEESQGLSSFELKQDVDAKQELLELEKIAETYYQNFQNELKEKQLAYQNIQMELTNLQEKNSQFEQNNQKANIQELKSQQDQIEEENLKLENDQLEQEKIDLQEKLTQTGVKIQELKSHKDGLIEQKEQLENRLNQSQVNYKQIEQEKIRLHNVVIGLSQEHKLTIKLKVKLEREIAQLEQKLISEKQIKMQLTQALQIKEGKINELEQSLINLDQKRLKQLKDKEKELNKVKGELVNKLTSGENTKEIHKEKEAKQKELVEIQQELSRTSTSYDDNRKKQVLNQVNNFLKAKEDFLTLREEAIERLQNCFNHLESSINEDRNTTNSASIIKPLNWLTKLEVNLMIENILKLNSFNLDKYKIFKFATNSQEGTRIQLNSNMMAEDINSLRKNLDELKLKLKQEKEGLKI